MLGFDELALLILWIHKSSFQKKGNLSNFALLSASPILTSMFITMPRKVITFLHSKNTLSLFLQVTGVFSMRVTWGEVYKYKNWADRHVMP
jgi:hypothetical protein